MIQEKTCPSCNNIFISKRKDTIACSRLCYTYSKHDKKIYPTRGKIRKDLTGKKFGRLLVIKFFDWVIYKYVNRPDTKKSRWLCKCDCGNEVIRRADGMENGTCKSCGCYNREKTIENNKKRALPNEQRMLNTIYYKYAFDAKKRKLQWKLSEEQFKNIITKNCFYCNDEPAEHKDENFKYHGIDRVNNNQGYILDNCVSCCTMCNRMKLDHLYQTFINQCFKIVKNHGLIK